LRFTPIKNFARSAAISEYFGELHVERCVDDKQKPAENGTKSKLPQNGLAQQFSFGVKRFASRRARRLFVAQKSLVYPMFESPLERPRALLRVISSYA
jgi:hypothetical protein